MNQRKKNIRQIIFLAVLVGVTTLVGLIKSTGEGIDFDRSKFSLDDNTVITTVVLEGSDFTNRFEYRNGIWEINNKYPIDQGMRDVFFALLSRVEVQRPVSEMERDSLVQFLESSGTRVTILNNLDTIKTYLAGGNEKRFQSYFMGIGEDQPYIVNIPGYQSFIAGIFKASENDWRSRYIWDIDWTNLNKLTLTIEDGTEPLTFEYGEGDNFIHLNGVNKLDTAMMMGYLESIAYLQTDKYLLPGEIPEYDRWIEVNKPEAIIEVVQIGNRRSSLEFYSSPEGRNYIPALLNKSELVLFQPSAYENIVATSSDFELEE